MNPYSSWPRQTLILAIVAVLSIVFYLLVPSNSLQHVTNIQWAATSTFFIGLCVGSAELIARYRDRTVEALVGLPSLFYLGVNALAALAAYELLLSDSLGLGQATGVLSKSGGPGMSLDPEMTQSGIIKAILIGGFASMALFRTSVFNVRIGDMNVGIGPAAILQIILRAADRATDRHCATPRGNEVADIMREVVFARAKMCLPLYCHALMQNVSLEEKAGLDAAVAVLERSDMVDEAKAYSLGLYLMSIVGTDVLRGAVNALGSSIKLPRPDQVSNYSSALAVGIEGLRPLLLACHALGADRGEAPLHLLANPVLTPGDAPPTEAERVIHAIGKLYRFYGSEVMGEAVKLALDKQLPPSARPDSDIEKLVAETRGQTVD